MTKAKINSSIYSLTLLIVLTFLFRIVAVYFIEEMNVDIDLSSKYVNEWNILLQNLIKFKSYSFYTFEGELIPSVYMPPMYPFFLYLIKVFTSFEGKNLLNAIFIAQIVLSTYSIYLFYQINQNFFSNNISLINSAVFSFFPLNIYVCGQVSSICLQILLSLLFLNLLLKLLKAETFKNTILFSIASGLLILTRGEFILIFFIIILFSIYKKKIKLINFVKIILIISLILSPYLIRNYMHFNQITLVKSLGYNLWKGNNELSSVQGYENYKNNKFEDLEFKIKNLEKNKYYEINRDNIFLKEAKNNLNEKPFSYLNLFFRKILSFYFIDLKSTYPNYYNIFNILPVLIIAIFSLPGLLLFLKKRNIKNDHFLIYLFSNLFIFSIFFILPRYKLIILPIQIIFAAYFVIGFLEKLTNVKKNNID